MLLPQTAHRTFSICIMVAILCGGSALVVAQKAEVPVMFGVDPEFETCSWGEITKTPDLCAPCAGRRKSGSSVRASPPAARRGAW